eukprot:jgi/Tetstr1/455943/TSEL_042724.t1
MVERCTRTQIAYASVEENTLQNRLTDEDMRGEYIHLPGGWTPTHSSNPALYRSLRHAWHWHTLLDVGADALAQYKLFLLDQHDLDGDIVDADTRLTYLRGSDSVWLQGAEDMLEIAARQAAVLVEHDDDGAMEPLLAGAHAEQFPLFQLMRLTARVVQEALTHTWIQTDRFSRFLSDITKEAHKWETDRAAIPGSTHHVGSFLPYAPLTWTATSPPRLAHMEPIHKWREGYFPTGPGARPASVAHCDASDPAVCNDVQRSEASRAELVAEPWRGACFKGRPVWKHHVKRDSEGHVINHKTFSATFFLPRQIAGVASFQSIDPEFGQDQFRRVPRTGDVIQILGPLVGTWIQQVGDLGKSAIKTDPGHAPPPPDFRDDTSSDGTFNMDGASDNDSEVVQHIKPAAVKPTLDLKNVPIWDNTISTRDNAQAIKIALGSAGYLDTTKGKGTRQEQMILLAALHHATAHYPMALAIVNNISMDSRKCGYTAWKALLTELQGSAMEERKRLEEEITAGQLPNEPVEAFTQTTIISSTPPPRRPLYVNEKLATIISAGQNMEARKRQRQQRVRACPRNLNSYSPRDPQHTTGPSVVCRRCDRPGHTQQQCVARRHANGLRILDDTTPTSTMTNPRYDRHQRAPAERRVNTNYGHHPRDNYRHQAPPGQPFYNDNRNNQDRPQRQQRWTNQGGNDGMQRRQQPVGFVSPAGHQHPGHQQASDTFTLRPTGHQEAYPFDHRSRAFASVISFIRFYLTTQPTPVRYIVENVPCALDFPEILSSLGTGNIMSATACGSAAHRDTLLWTNIASQTDIQDYINNINAIELTDPNPCAWDLYISEFPHFTPVVTTNYFPNFVARPGSYAFRMQTNGQPGTGMVYEHDGPWSWADNGRWCEPPAALCTRAMGFTLDDLPTSRLSEATLRKLLGGVIELNVMRNYIKAVSGAAPSPAVIIVCHTSYGTLITSDGEAWVLIDSEHPLTVGLTNISRLLGTHQLSKQGYSFYFSRLLNSMITPDGAVIHLQPYPGTTGMYGIKLLPIRV